MWSNSLCSQPVKSCGIWAADHKAKQRWKCNKHREQHTDFGHWESDISFLVSQKDCGLVGQRAGAELLIHSDTAASVCCKCSNLTGQRAWVHLFFFREITKLPIRNLSSKISMSSPCHIVISSYPCHIHSIHRQQPHRHRLKTLHRLIRNGPVQLRCIDTQRCQSLVQPLVPVSVGIFKYPLDGHDKHNTQTYILIYLDIYIYIIII